MKLILIKDNLVNLYDYEIFLLIEDGIEYEVIMEDID